MNRQQAIAAATHFRKGRRVYTINTERKPFVPAVPEVKDEAGNITQEAVAAKPAEKRTYRIEDFEYINEAKRRMHELGRGVALKTGEFPPV